MWPVGIIHFLTMNKVQIIYPLNDEGSIIEHFTDEANEMQRAGFIIDSIILEDIDLLIYRGFKIWKEEQCINHSKIIQSWEAVHKTSYMQEYYPIIESNSIPTVFRETLDKVEILEISTKNNWHKIFIKSPSRSLFGLGHLASVWPNTSIEEIKKNYSERNLKGPFAIRKFIDNPEIFYNEQRYWILNGKAHHPSGVIPDFVKENGKKMYDFSGSHYFTMDVAGHYIVEINPGESSDRGGDNPLDWFCGIFAETFLK